MPQHDLSFARVFRLRFLALALTILLAAAWTPLLRAQTAGEGSITGTVADSTGAVVGNAKVTATNQATNVAASRTSTKDGLYTISPLPPGLYTLTVEAPGFKLLKQENLDVVGLGQLGFNPVLSIGTTSETVEVSSAPPVLDTESATLGAVIENDVYSNLPLVISATQERDPTAFALLVPGAQPGTDGRLPSLSGTPGHQASIYLDGVPSETLNQQGDNRTIALAVDVDAVDQFQVMTSVAPAEYMGAGAENFTIKSGTLKYHGSVADFIRNTAFDTYTFSQKQATVTPASAPFDCKAPAVTCPAPKGIEHTNELSATFGGHVPHTADKLFFFIAYDKFHGRQGTSVNFTTIPTALEEQGDFTELNQNANALPGGGLTGLPGDPSDGGLNKAFLYDPMTNNCVGAVCTRQPFQGLKNGIPTYNVIPAADISPISKQLESYLPNYPGSPNAGHVNSVLTNVLSGNYGNQGTNGRDNYNWDWRFDYDVSAKNRISTVGAMGHDVYATNFSNFYSDAPYTTGNLPLIVPKVYDVEDAYTITPRLTNQLKFGYTRFYMPLFAPTVGGSFAPGAFGITNLPGGQGGQDFPNISFGASNFGPGTKISQASWGATVTGQATQVTIPNTYAVVDNLQYLKGNHIITAGFSFMWEGLNNANPTTLTSILPLAFRQSSTANYIAGTNNIDTDSTASSGTTGYGYASFLLGAANPISGYNLAYAPTQYTRSKLAAPYIEDHWHATRKLVIDAGLRWDYIPPVHEKAIRLPNGDFTFSYLNPTIINPAAGLPGALEFAGNYGGQTGTISCGCTTPVQTYWKNWGPRIGVVYQIDDKTVFRIGAGITYSQGGGTGGGLLSGGVGGANSSGQILGSSTTANSPNPITSGPNAGPSFYLGSQAYLGASANTDLFGKGYAYPGPPVPGVATQNLDAGNYLDGSGNFVTPGAMGYVDPYQSGRAPEYTFYNVGFQRTITRDMTLTVSYVGSEAHHTYNKSGVSPRGYWSNQLNPIYLLGLGPLAGTNSAGKANGIPLLLAPATSFNVGLVNAAMPNSINLSTANNFITAANKFPTQSTLTVGQLLLAFPQYNNAPSNQLFDNWGGPNTDNFSYNAFQLTLNQRMAHGLSFNINYTFQKDLGDDGSFRSGFDIPAGAVDGSTQAYKADRIDRGLTSLDLPENLVAYGVYKLPFGTGHLGGNNLLTRQILGGWQLAGTYTYGSGGPVSVTWSGGCANQAVPNGVSCLPSLNPAFSGSARQNGSYGTGPNGVVLPNNKIQYLNLNAFQAPKDISTVAGFHQYLIGNAPRTAPFGLRNPGNQNLNASVKRAFALPGDRATFVFQADCTNVWNKQTWGGPNGGWSVGSTTFGTSGAPGQIRAFQFSGHLNF